MLAVLTRALIGALVNPKVVDRILVMVDQVVRERNSEQTNTLREEVQRLHAALVVRIDNVEHGLERLGVQVRADRERVRRLEAVMRATLPELPDNIPPLPDEAES